MTFGTARKWTDFASDGLEQHYNPRVATPDSERYGAARAGINTQGLAWPGRQADIAYGDGDLMDLDIYVPSGGAGSHPVHFYIHGGYWRSRAKEDFGFIGASLAKQGLLAVVINYPLCPAVTLDEVVAGTCRAFGWVAGNIATYGGDPARITLSGHSAGAHLGAAVIAHDWQAGGLSERPLQGAVLISGIYDPAPTQHISVNAEIGITPELAQRHNYAAQPPRIDCPVHVIVGGGEPEGWIAQSTDYANHMAAAGRDVAYTVSGSENHFSIQDQYLDPASDTLSAILEQAGR